MSLLQELSYRKAAFYFLEREHIALAGGRELDALLAEWIEPQSKLLSLPNMVPVWHGSYLPFEAALERWAIGDVFAVIVGTPNAKMRRSLVKRVREFRPIGLFDVDADADRLDLPLVFAGFALPGAFLKVNENRSWLDRESGMRIIGVPDEGEQAVLGSLVAFAGDDDRIERAVLNAIARDASRSLRNVKESDGFSELVDHAFELFHLGSVGAAGLVGGVAFESLMRASLVGEDADWLEVHEQKQPASLNNVISKAVSRNQWDQHRLRGYQGLRNDLAHRLESDQPENGDHETLKSRIDEFLRWLDLQSVDEDGVAHLVNVAPTPEISFADLLKLASEGANASADAAQTTLMRIGSDVFEPDGFAWVYVRGKDRPFPRWLIENGHASEDIRGARLSAPYRSFERNLAWAHSFTTQLRSFGHPTDMDGAPD